MAVTEKQFAQAVRKYNDIMYSICREFNTVGTKDTEDKENRNRWNIRDLVSEMQYVLDIYNDPTCIYWEDAHDPYQPDGNRWLKAWNSDRAKMSRFINRWKPFIEDVVAHEGHCSIYD